MVTISDIEHAMLMYLKTFEKYKRETVGTDSFTDGWAFATILRSASNFKISHQDLIGPTDKWTFKLSNLKKIVAMIQEYFELEINKGIKTKDIDLVQISRNSNIQELAKMFELVIAVLTEAPNKEDHINNIMSLDERSQSTFVSIIQNILENRVIDRTQPKQNMVFIEIHQLQNENSILKQEVENLLHHNFQIEKQNDELKQKQKNYEEELEELRGQKIDRQVPTEQNKEKEHLKNMIENLKEKLLMTVRDHEMKMSLLKEEVMILEGKLLKYEEIEEQLEVYKKKYRENIESYGKSKLWEREISKLNRIIDEKQQLIRKLNKKLEEANETNYLMQEKQLYAKMELQKRDIRFKQLEKQVKKRYENSAPTGISQPESSNPHVPSLGEQMNQLHQEQLQELRSELDQLKKKLKDSERQNNRVKRNMEKMTAVEGDKKKLERLILDINNDKNQQISFLLSVTYDMFRQGLKRTQENTQISQQNA